MEALVMEFMIYELRLLKDSEREQENMNDNNALKIKMFAVVISKEIGKPTVYGNRDINEIYDFLKERLSGTPDGTIKQNRQFAKLLLNKFKKDYPDKKPVKLICFLIDLALKDDFHSKNATSFKYLYYNAQKIIQSSKVKKSNPIIL